MDEKKFNTSYAFIKPRNKRSNPKPPHGFISQKVRFKDDVEYIALKEWQKEAFDLLKDAKKGLIKAFCGCGKTIAARSIGAYKAQKYNQTQVYCVPRTDIGLDGFGSFCNIEVQINGKNKIVKCNTPLNFCKPTNEKIQGLIDVLTNDPEQDSGENISTYKQIVCTHQCLALAIKKIKNKPGLLKKFFENKTWWIDEGHHVKNSKSKLDKIIRNHLGDFVSYILENPDTNSEIFIMTATPYRADHGCIISEEQSDGFTSYSLDFLKHFATLGITNVDMNLEEYRDTKDLFNRVANNLRKEIKTNKHFVFVPPTGKKWRRKKEDVYKLLDVIYKVVMEEFKVTLEVAKTMVLDLVTERTQKFNDKLLRQEPKNGQSHASKYVVVVACMKCREGSDWCPADRLHNTSMEQSPPQIFQMNGRLFREFPGKESVKINYYVKEFLPEGKTKREFVSDTVNVMLYYMLMDDLLNPIMLDIPYFTPKVKNEKVSNNKPRTTLADHFGLNYFEAKKALLKSFENSSLNDQNANRLITNIINKYLPNKTKYSKKHITEIKNAWKVFLIRTASKNLRSKRIVDISYIRKNGFDVIAQKEGISGNIFTSNISIDDMRKFRELSRLKSWDQEIVDKKNEYLIDFAEKTLGRKVLKSRVVKDTKNPDYEALKVIKSEHVKFKVFNDKINITAKQKKVFSTKEIASSLKISEDELRFRISRWSKSFLPSNWKDDLLHHSWQQI